MIIFLNVNEMLQLRKERSLRRPIYGTIVLYQTDAVNIQPACAQVGELSPLWLW